MALGIILSMASPANAGMCPEPVSGRTECSGEARMDDLTQRIEAGTGVTITDDDTFGLSVMILSRSGERKGIDVTSTSSTGDITIDLDGNISADAETINVYQNGNGNVSIMTRGTVSSYSREGILIQTASTATGMIEITATEDIRTARDGIRVSSSGTGGTTVHTKDEIDSLNNRGIHITAKNSQAGAIRVTTERPIDSQLQGINIAHAGTGSVTVVTDDVDSDVSEGVYVSVTDPTNGASPSNTSSIDITTNGDIDAEREGIHVAQVSAAAVTVTANGEVKSDTDEGINIGTQMITTGDITVTINGGVLGEDAGIFINDQGSGDIIININGEVTGDDGTVVSLQDSGAGNTRAIWTH